MIVFTSGRSEGKSVPIHADEGMKPTPAMCARIPIAKLDSVSSQTSISPRLAFSVNIGAKPNDSSPK